MIIYDHITTKWLRLLPCNAQQFFLFLSHKFRETSQQYPKECERHKLIDILNESKDQEC